LIPKFVNLGPQYATNFGIGALVQRHETSKSSKGAF
jgi:hypothetical protein